MVSLLSIRNVAAPRRGALARHRPAGGHGLRDDSCDDSRRPGTLRPRTQVSHAKAGGPWFCMPNRIVVSFPVHPGVMPRWADGARDFLGLSNNFRCGLLI